MKASGWKALVISVVAFVAVAVADMASGTKRGDARMVAGHGMVGPAEPADDVGATDRESVPEEIGVRGTDGTSAPAGVQGEDDPESEYAADGDDVTIAASRHIRWKGPSGDDRATAAPGDSAQARAPPALLPATRTDPGA